MRVVTPSCVLVAVVIASAVGIAQNREQPTFNSGVQVIRIDVSVIDGKREPVRGLQQSDFTVLEDGQSRPIRSFQAVDAAAARTTRAAAMPPMELLPAHNVVTNQMSSDASRLIFILMDRSMEPERPMIVARQIADAAVDAMEPGDLAAIVTTGVQGVAQNLTSDRARLHQTIASTDWSQMISRAITDTEVAGVLDLNNAAQDGRCMCGLCAMDTITQIANAVREMPRRKVLLFIGSSITVQTGDVDCAQRLRISREKLFEALGTSGLTVHSIDPQGMASVGPATRSTVRNGVVNRDGRVLNHQSTGRARRVHGRPRFARRPAGSDWWPRHPQRQRAVPARARRAARERRVLPGGLRADRSDWRHPARHPGQGRARQCRRPHRALHSRVDGGRADGRDQRPFSARPGLDQSPAGPVAAARDVGGGVRGSGSRPRLRRRHARRLGIRRPIRIDSAGTSRCWPATRTGRPSAAPDRPAPSRCRRRRPVTERSSRDVCHAAGGKL